MRLAACAGGVSIGFALQASDLAARGNLPPPTPTARSRIAAPASAPKINPALQLQAATGDILPGCVIVAGEGASLRARDSRDGLGGC